MTSEKTVAQIVLQRLRPTQDIRLVESAVNPLPVVREGWPVHWPTCPDTCNPVEWRRSLEARDHYIATASADGNKRAWFQYPKYTYQYSEFVYCTPDMASKLLEFMPVNRKKKASWAEAIKRDILNNRWLQTHESIAINTEGNMHDGQHRASGIILADTGWPIYFTWNVPPEALFVTDSGEKRKINEKLGFLFPDVNQRTAPLCRSMMWGLAIRGTRFSESEIAEFANKHQKVIEWISSTLRGFRADVQGAIAKCLMWYGEKDIKPFVDRITNVQFIGDGDPAKALYLWLQRSKEAGKKLAYANPTVHYKKTLSAVLSHINGKDTTKLYQKQEDVFEWEEDWEVPKNAPCKGIVFNGTQSVAG